MDDLNGGPGASLSAMGVPLAGPICYQRQCSPSALCQSAPFPECIPLGCHQSQLVRPRTSIRLSSVEDGDNPSDQVQSLVGRVYDLDSTDEDDGIMVAGTVGVEQGKDAAVSSTAAEPEGGRRRHSLSSEDNDLRPPRLAPLAATRVQILTNVFISQGHDAEVAALMAVPQRDTSVAVYENHWRRFAVWLQTQGLTLEEVSSAVLSKYLHSLFVSGLSVSTIKSHRSAVSPLIRAVSGYNPSEDRGLTDLCRRLAIERPRLQRVFPEWSLDVVLRHFLSPPYVGADNSDRNLSLEHLTRRTVFLLSLATGRRVSCLHGLSHDVVLQEGPVASQQVLVFRTLPEFRSKTQRPSEVPLPLLVPGSAHLVPNDLERFLCPVRSVRMYLARTVEKHQSSRRLFVHWRPARADIKISHVSRWITKCIFEAYNTEGLDAPDRARAHELRALSGSWAHWNGVSMEDIKHSLCWRSDGVFQNSYLRSMSSVADGLRRLSPLVAAGALVP